MLNYQRVFDALMVEGMGLNLHTDNKKYHQSPSKTWQSRWFLRNFCLMVWGLSKLKLPEANSSYQWPFSTKLIKGHQVTSMRKMCSFQKPFGKWYIYIYSILNIHTHIYIYYILLYILYYIYMYIIILYIYHIYILFYVYYTYTILL